MYTRPHPSASLPQLRPTPNSGLSTQHSRRPASGDAYDRPGPPRTTSHPPRTTARRPHKTGCAHLRPALQNKGLRLRALPCGRARRVAPEARSARPTDRGHRRPAGQGPVSPAQGDDSLLGSARTPAATLSNPRGSFGCIRTFHGSRRSRPAGPRGRWSCPLGPGPVPSRLTPGRTGPAPVRTIQHRRPHHNTRESRQSEDETDSKTVKPLPLSGFC